MPIIIDSRAAGQGKTCLGIYPRIHRLLDMNERILLVLPSIDLQDQYRTEFESYSDFEVINHTSAVEETVTHQIIRSLTSQTRTIVCITHAAWLRLNLPPAVREQWHLIIDEVIKPYDTVEWVRGRDPIDWRPLLQLPEYYRADSNENNWWPIGFEVDLKDPWLGSIEPLRRLASTNWLVHARTSSINGMSADRSGRIEFVRELDPDLIQGWASQYVAAAAFETTLMAAWCRKNTIRCEYLHEFEPRHAGRLIMHVPTDPDFRWSNHKRKTQISIHENYNIQVTHRLRELGDPEIVAIRNNGSYLSFDNEHRLKHNSHGQNHYLHVPAASCETALIPSPIFSAYLQDQVDMSRREITAAYSAYEFYQMIMRTALRDHEFQGRVDVFLLDTHVATELIGLFDPDQFEVRDDIDLGLNKKSQPLTNAEHQKRYRQRQKERIQQLRNQTQQ